MRLLADGEVQEWDCLHEDGELSGSEHSYSSEDDDDESMEDLSEPLEEAEGSQEEEKGENNSCISIYFQSKRHDLETAVSLQLMEQVLDDHFYDELRNKEQCGYYVAATRR